MDSKSKKIINSFYFQWGLYIILGLILLYLFSWFGECGIHEIGHYAVGRFFGCNNLIINCSISKDTSNFVISGWKHCPINILKGDGKTLECSFASLLVTSGGFLSFTLFFLGVLYFLYIPFFRYKIKLDRRLFWLLIALIIVESFSVAASDFHKISLCFNLDKLGYFIKQLSLYKLFLKSYLAAVLLVFMLGLFKHNFKKLKLVLKI